MPLWLISSGNWPPKTFSAHFLRKSAATKLFRLISSGNRPPQNFFGSFPQEIGRHKLFRLISSGNRPPQNFFGSFLQEIGRHKLFRLISSGNRPPQNFFSSFPQEIARHKTFSAHFLRKSAATYSLISSGNRLTNPRTLSLFAAGLSLPAARPWWPIRIIYSNKMKESIHIQNFGPLRDVRIDSPQ